MCRIRRSTHHHHHSVVPVWPFAVLLAALCAYYLNAACFARCRLTTDGRAAAHCTHQCAGEVHIGDVTLAYLMDMKEIIDHGMIRGLCKTRPAYPQQGVDIARYPDGWEEQLNGSWTGCEERENVLGTGTVGYSTHAVVSAELRTVARRQRNGEIWRGNELGMLQCSDLFWDDVEPKAVGLAMTPSQKAALRPLLTRMLYCDASCAARVQTMVADYLAERTHLKVKEDLGALVQIILHEILFPGEVYPFDHNEFTAIQDSFVDSQIPAQMLPRFAARMLLAKTLSKLSAYVEHYRNMAMKHYGVELAQRDCSPTADCYQQLGRSFLDMFLAAGGLALPHGLKAGLYVLHADTTQHGDIFPQTFALQSEAAAEFFYESIRFFSPVAAFPYWSGPPGSANRTRTLLNVCMADKDPNVWGADHAKFRVRSLKEYKEKFTGFADFAVDDEDNGEMDHWCPGKGLAVTVGKIFFKQMLAYSWKITEESAPVYVPRFPYIEGEFTLKKVKRGE